MEAQPTYFHAILDYIVFLKLKAINQNNAWHATKIQTITKFVVGSVTLLIHNVSLNRPWKIKIQATFDHKNHGKFNSLRAFRFWQKIFLLLD